MGKSDDFLRENNLASHLIPRLGPDVDADFSRAVTELVQAVEQTLGKGEVALVLKAAPSKDSEGTVMLTHEVKRKIPVLPNKPRRMHVAPDGSLQSQMEFLLGGGRDEVPRVVPLDAPGQERVPLDERPAPPPMADRPSPAPMAGKDLAAEQGRDRDPDDHA